MNRRNLLSVMLLAATSGTAHSQTAARKKRVAIVMPYKREDGDFQRRVRIFQTEVIKLGWQPSALEFDEHWTSDDIKLVEELAPPIIKSDPNMIVTIGSRVISIFRRLTQSIPILVPGGPDFESSGWAKSIAKPGGNITGFALMELSSYEKMLHLLKEVSPTITQVGVLFNSQSPNGVLYTRAFDKFAASAGLRGVHLPVSDTATMEAAFASLAGLGDTGVLAPTDLTISGLREDVAAFGKKYRIPGIYSDRLIAGAGGLMSYDADRDEIFKRSAEYADRILRGERAGELPIQLPNRYELTVNARAAQEMGIVLPDGIIAAADYLLQ